jgi:DNA-binding XRE family transcriptional regulator
VNRVGLRTWRQLRYLTQRDLADLLDVDKITVYRWERGPSPVPPYLHLALDQLDSQHTWSPNGSEARVA